MAVGSQAADGSRRALKTSNFLIPRVQFHVGSASAPASAVGVASASGGAPSAAPETVPGSGSRGFGVLGFFDEIQKALQCQDSFQRLYGSDADRIRAALGKNCQEATLDVAGCCLDTAAFLNGPDFRGCACNQQVYNRLCEQVKLPPSKEFGTVDCSNLFTYLQTCGLEC